jgi:hypothetical protein
MSADNNMRKEIKKGVRLTPEERLKAAAEKRRLAVEKLNRKFAKSSAGQKRVIIAQDILDQLKAQVYKPETGYYVRDLRVKDGSNPATRYNRRLDLRSNLDQIESCEVCALGACLMSSTRFANTLKISDVARVERISKIPRARTLLGELFLPQQLLLIEEAYEAFNRPGLRFARSAFDFEMTHGQCEKAINFGLRYKDNLKRMTAIMRNIIKNKGTFKPWHPPQHPASRSSPAPLQRSRSREQGQG